MTTPANRRSSEGPPRIVVIAGPNGAGKSTSAVHLLRGPLAVGEFVNADVIARGLSGLAPESVAVAAGRIMLTRLRELAAQRVSFAFETTLASRSFAPWIEQLVDSGYRFTLIYLWLPTVEGAIGRVAERVRRGGHSVPDEIIKRRYHAGLRNFFDLYRPLASSWRLVDNSEDEPRTIAEGVRVSVHSLRDRDTWQRVQQSVINDPS